MDLENVALEAVKVKIQEIFNKVAVSTAIEGKDIVIRISLPDEIRRNNTSYDAIDKSSISAMNTFKPSSNLDQEAQAAADDLLGNNLQEST